MKYSLLIHPQTQRLYILCNKIHWGFRIQNGGESKLPFILLTVKLKRQRKTKIAKTNIQSMMLLIERTEYRMKQN